MKPIYLLEQSSTSGAPVTESVVKVSSAQRAIDCASTPSTSLEPIKIPDSEKATK